MKLAILEIHPPQGTERIGDMINRLSAQRFTVLVADDSSNDHLFAKRGLASSCVLRQVGAVTTGEAVRDYLLGKGIYTDRSHFPVPDLLLLDLDMPGIGGLEVLKWLQTQDFPSLRVVVLSGNQDRAKIGQAIEYGADYFQAKSGDQQEIKAFIHRLELLMILLARREPPKGKPIMSKVISVVDARGPGPEKLIRAAADNKMNFLLVLNNEDELTKLWSALGTTNIVPDRLERWGIAGMVEVVTAQDYALLLELYRDYAIYLVEQLTLNRNVPPRTKPIMIYCELRGIVSEHETVEEAGLSLLDYLSSFSQAKLLPLAGIYEYYGTAWRRVKKLTSN